MVGNIDDLDRKIVWELQEDARKVLKAIARKLKVSEETIKNRVNRLIEKDILILGAKVNPLALPNKVAAVVAVNLTERNHEQKMRQIKKYQISPVCGMPQAVMTFFSR